MDDGEIDVLVLISVLLVVGSLIWPAARNRSSGMELAQRGDMRIVSATNLRNAVQLLVDQQGDALIFDRPAIRYYLKNNPNLALRLAPPSPCRKRPTDL